MAPRARSPVALHTLPASCALDAEGAAAQRERYRRIGTAAEVIHRDARRLTVRVGDGIDGGLVERAVETERRCCPFFDIDWRPADGELTIAVRETSHEPALDAIAWALDAEL